VQSYYIRTAKELSELILEFRDSNFRYLHLACHGNAKGIQFTYDYIPLEQLASIVAPALHDRRLFLSACQSTRGPLARELFRHSSCYSVIGPKDDPRFHDATLAWALFYSLMSKANREVMKQAEIKLQLQSVCDLLDIRFNAFFNNKGIPQHQIFRRSVRSTGNTHAR
jgi:hypothetical protein